MNDNITFEELPNDIWFLIFILLDPISYTRLSGTCVKLYILISRDNKFRQMTRIHLTERCIANQSHMQFYKQQMSCLLNTLQQLQFFTNKKSLTYKAHIDNAPIIFHQPFHDILNLEELMAEKRVTSSNLSGVLIEIVNSGNELFFIKTINRLQLSSNNWSTLLLAKQNDTCFIQTLCQLNSHVAITTIIDKISDDNPLFIEQIYKLLHKTLVMNKFQTSDYLINYLYSRNLDSNIIISLISHPSLDRQAVDYVLHKLLMVFLNQANPANLLHAFLLSKFGEKDFDTLLEFFSGMPNLLYFIDQHTQSFEQWPSSEQEKLLSLACLYRSVGILNLLLNKLPRDRALQLIYEPYTHDLLHVASIDSTPEVLEFLFSFLDIGDFERVILTPNSNEPDEGRSMIYYARQNNLLYLLKYIAIERRVDVLTRQEDADEVTLLDLISGDNDKFNLRPKPAIQFIHCILGMLTEDDRKRLFVNFNKRYLELFHFIISETHEISELDNFFIIFNPKELYELSIATDQNGRNLLHKLAAHAHIDRLAYILDKFNEVMPTLLCALDNKLRLPLHYAAKSGCADKAWLIFNSTVQFFSALTLLHEDYNQWNVLNYILWAGHHGLFYKLIQHFPLAQQIQLTQKCQVFNTDVRNFQLSTSTFFSHGNRNDNMFIEQSFTSPDCYIP